MVSFWPPVVFRFGIVLAIAGVAGIAFGTTAGLLVAVVGLLGLVGLHLYYLRRVVSWLAPHDVDRLTIEFPQGFGAWESVFQALRQWQRRASDQHTELERMLQRFMQATSALPDGIIILDAADRVEWCNARAGDHFGLIAERDRGFNISNLVRHPAFTDYLVSSDTSTPLLIADEVRGTVLSVQLLPFQETFRIVLSRDVSHLQRVEAMRQDFIANVSHEIRTPLTVIVGFLEHLADTPELNREERSRIEAVMLEQSRRMRRLIDDLLTLSKLETEHAPSSAEYFALAPLIEEAVADAKALSRGRHTIEPQVLVEADVLGARDEMMSALENLVSNAVRYTPPGGTITVRAERASHALRISVTDTGPGIAPVHIPRLTERFYRVDKSRSRETGGTGLGLAIVKHVLQRHGGSLDIQSTEGRGSTFTMVLPLARVRSR
jgi:two-component system phosphate regulon sensor histidine kinase PhoR